MLENKAFYLSAHCRCRQGVLDVLVTYYSKALFFMSQISIISLASPEKLKREALDPLPRNAQALLESLMEVQLPPASGGHQAHIERVRSALEGLLEQEQTADVLDISDPETPHAELSDNYFGVRRDDSESSIVTLSHGALRALYAVLIDIEQHSTSLTPVEIGNLLKMPLIHAMMVENEVVQLKEAA